MKTYYKIYSIKYERVLALFYIPFMLINILKASQEMILLAMMMHLILILGLYIGIEQTRKEALKEIKQGIYEPIIDLEYITYFIKQLARIMQKKANKKEVINTQYTNRQTYILKKSF